jgi:hypothetical protein
MLTDRASQLDGVRPSQSPRARGRGDVVTRLLQQLRQQARRQVLSSGDTIFNSVAWVKQVRCPSNRKLLVSHGRVDREVELVRGEGVEELSRNPSQVLGSMNPRSSRG